MTVSPLAGEALYLSGLGPRPEFLLAAAATALIETPVFWLCGCRKGRELFLFAAINIISNLLLNEFLADAAFGIGAVLSVILGEVFVLALEYVLCGYGVKSLRGRRLFRALLLTNMVSFLAGELFFFGTG